jgi:hypothetical protein
MHNFLKSLGYFLIWGDFYLVLFFIHSLFVSPITVEDYFLDYWQVALDLFQWLGSLNEIMNIYLLWWLSLPASLLFSLRFIFSTSIGILIIKKIN